MATASIEQFFKLFLSGKYVAPNDTVQDLSNLSYLDNVAMVRELQGKPMPVAGILNLFHLMRHMEVTKQQADHSMKFREYFDKLHAKYNFDPEELDLIYSYL